MTSAFRSNSRTTAVETDRTDRVFLPAVSLPNPTALADQLSRVERLLEPIAPKLQLVEDELRRNFESKIPTISDVGDHILAGGGKRLRPALLLLASKVLQHAGYAA